MTHNGYTEDGRMVIGGVFRLYGTNGLPLEIILQMFQAREWVVDWVDYINDAQKDGHKLKTIVSRIEAAADDIYGPDHAEAIKERCSTFFEP